MNNWYKHLFATFPPLDEHCLEQLHNFLFLSFLLFLLILQPV